jgi:FkbM family methyltransferase
MRSVKRRIELLAWLGSRLGKPPGFERVVRFLAPPESCAKLPEVCLVRDGSLFLTKLALPLGWHIGFFGSYEPELRDIMRAVLPVGGTAVDVGANAGWHTLLMARLVGPGGRVLAVEPNPSVRQHLLRNLAINAVTQVEVDGAALAEAAGTLNFVAPAADDPASASGHVVSNGLAPAEAIRVVASTLDALVADKKLDRIDLLKIDAEGFEWPILQGAERSIARFRPAIIFEFDRAYAARGSDSGSLFAEFFRRHRYRLFAVGRNWSELIDASAWPANANIFASPTPTVEVPGRESTAAALSCS